MKWRTMNGGALGRRYRGRCFSGTIEGVTSERQYVTTLGTGEINAITKALRRQIQENQRNGVGDREPLSQVLFELISKLDDRKP